MKKNAPRAGSGVFPKLLLLLLLLLALTQLFRLRRKIDLAQAEKAALASAVARQQQDNSALSSAIDKAGDAEYLQDLAREQLGVVTPDEKVFYDVSN